MLLKGSGGGRTEVGIWRTEQIGKGRAREIFWGQPEALGFLAELVGLRRWEFERQFHMGNVARATPSNKRLPPTAASAMMSRLG